MLLTGLRNALGNFGRQGAVLGVREDACQHALFFVVDPLIAQCQAQQVFEFAEVEFAIVAEDLDRGEHDVEVGMSAGGACGAVHCMSLPSRCALSSLNFACRQSPPPPAPATRPLRSPPW